MYVYINVYGCMYMNCKNIVIDKQKSIMIISELTSKLKAVMC